MGVKWKVKMDKTPLIEAAAKELDGRSIEVGADWANAWLVGIHEFGCTIRPRGQYLTVPLIPEARGRKARDFPGLFVYTAKTGNKFLARSKGRSIECVYWLAKEVTIPERAFLRGGMEHNRPRLDRELKLNLKAVFGGNMGVSEMLNKQGEHLASWIKAYAKSGDFEPNSPITIGIKASTNPLVDTGAMIASISHKVK